MTVILALTQENIYYVFEYRYILVNAITVELDQGPKSIE